MVRWHYQWVVLNDFLPTIIGDETLNKILPHREKSTNPLVDPPKLEFYKPKKEAFIPIEFSTAAYRFGHFMVRDFGPTRRISGSIGRYSSRWETLRTLVQDRCNELIRSTLRW